MLAAGSWTAASAFVMSPRGGLALRHGPAAAHPSLGTAGRVRARDGGRQRVAMQLPPLDHVAEPATLLATAASEFAPRPDYFYKTFISYPGPLVDGMKSYFNLFVPTLKALNLPPFLLHWFHAINMGIVLVALGGYGAYLGWNMRMRPEDKFEVAPLPAPLAGSPIDFGKSTAEMHATLMSAMGLIFFLGANGGLVLSLVNDKPITESVHFTTALVGFAMLAVQGSLTKLFAGQNAQAARTAHALFGTATLLLFVFHAFQGFKLGMAYAGFDEMSAINLQWVKMRQASGDAWQ